MHGLKRIIALAVVGLAGCTAPAPQAPEVDRQAIEAEVLSWLQSYWAAWADGGDGFDRGIAMLDDHPDFTLAADGGLWRSVASADEAFRPFFQTIDHQTFDIPVTTIAVLGPDLAYAAQRGTYQQWNVDGTDTGPLPFAATYLLVRSNGVWKARAYHQSEPNVSTTDAQRP